MILPSWTFAYQGISWLFALIQSIRSLGDLIMSEVVTIIFPVGWPFLEWAPSKFKIVIIIPWANIVYTCCCFLYLTYDILFLLITNLRPAPSMTETNPCPFICQAMPLMSLILLLLIQ